MKDAQFVNAQNVETLEQYGAALLTSMVSLRTLELFQATAVRKGILDTDEIECSQTIVWEIRRLIMLYKKQMQNVLDRTDITTDKMMEDFRALMPGFEPPPPEVKKKRKKKVKE